MSATPSFTGKQVLVLHRPGEASRLLVRQLGLLGLRTTLRWSSGGPADAPDLVIVDADAGWSGLLPWPEGRNPVPLIALLGSEAPGRIAWALDQGADALIAKPVAPSAVYPALVMAVRRHEEGRRTAERIADLEERIRLRPLVLGAVEAIMAARSCTEAEAYRHLRREAMRQRLVLEQMAARILAGPRSEAG